MQKIWALSLREVALKWENLLFEEAPCLLLNQGEVGLDRIGVAIEENYPFDG